MVLALAGLAFAVTSSGRGVAQTSPEPAPSVSPGASSPSPTPADCTIAGIDEIAGILGYRVNPADDSSRSGGVCFYASHTPADDGSASYAIVDKDRLAQRRAYYGGLAKRCADVPNPPNAAVCKSDTGIAQAKDIEAYYAARTDFPNSEPVKGLGDAAVAAGEALYVKRGDIVFEFAVKHGNALDVERSAVLAKLVLARVPAAAPEPSASPRRPKAS